MPRVRVEVRVPAVEHPSDYEALPYDPTIMRVLNEFEETGFVSYEVKTADGTLKEVCVLLLTHSLS